MEIRRTIKPEFKDAGRVTTINEEKMREIIMQVQTLGFLNYNQTRGYCSEGAMEQLRATGKIESFYATYEPIAA